MVQTVITPQHTNFDLSILLPKEFVGKKVHVLFYVEDEITNAEIVINENKKPSNYFGSLSKKEAKELEEYVNQKR